MAVVRKAAATAAAALAANAKNAVASALKNLKTAKAKTANAQPVQTKLSAPNAAPTAALPVATRPSVQNSAARVKAQKARQQARPSAQRATKTAMATASLRVNLAVKWRASHAASAARHAQKTRASATPLQPAANLTRHRCTMPLAPSKQLRHWAKARAIVSHASARAVIAADATAGVVLIAPNAQPQMKPSSKRLRLHPKAVPSQAIATLSIPSPSSTWWCQLPLRPMRCKQLL